MGWQDSQWAREKVENFKKINNEEIKNIFEETSHRGIRYLIITTTKGLSYNFIYPGQNHHC